MIQEDLPEWPSNAGELDPRLAGYWLDQGWPTLARYTQRKPVSRPPEGDGWVDWDRQPPPPDLKVEVLGDGSARVNPRWWRILPPPADRPTPLWRRIINFIRRIGHGRGR